ncbi:hypothetical protein H8959_008668 [Pygathrix nigripes]
MPSSVPSGVLGCQVQLRKDLDTKANLLDGQGCEGASTSTKSLEVVQGKRQIKERQYMFMLKVVGDFWQLMVEVGVQHCESGAEVLDEYFCQSALKTKFPSSDLQEAAPLRWQLSKAGLGEQEKRRGLGGKRGRSHVTSFPRSLSCRPPSNRCVPPSDACASRLALGGGCGKAMPTVALLIGSRCCRSDPLPGRPQAVLSDAPPLGRQVRGWLAAAVTPRPFPCGQRSTWGGRKRGRTGA